MGINAICFELHSKPKVDYFATA